MENLYIKGTFKTPTLSFNFEKGELDISGRSLPEHSIEFYKEAMQWLDKYIENPKPETVVNVQLEYFNTSSSKVILDIFKKIELLHSKGNKVTVNWYYEEDDTDMQEQGETFAEIIKVPIKHIAVKEFDFVFV
ncbi:MAG: DUF1987 domain-containing protein [Bacteroidetes bacterium]|nr:DUF1987 domain-containing protein [Bacteroidota bacterium]MBV6460158.1 hypothetical protein [Flavobacteriales bacterium]WKZ74030.1 MAG: DUF1987 domain-containing protein [Vicingaceae bacterium]MCL4817396.1 SiaC family regulatory phosphoprotein [Flavobacteriales bacterium]NOG96066.1 DUF1987 domain-containing protein [Bacteroidota bacterium]